MKIKCIASHCDFEVCLFPVLNQMAHFWLCKHKKNSLCNNLASSGIQSVFMGPKSELSHFVLLLVAFGQVIALHSHEFGVI